MTVNRSVHGLLRAAGVALAAQTAVGVAFIVTHWWPLYVAWWPILGLELAFAVSAVIVAWRVPSSGRGDDGAGGGDGRP